MEELASVVQHLKCRLDRIEGLLFLSDFGDFGRLDKLISSLKHEATSSSLGQQPDPEKAPVVVDDYVPSVWEALPDQKHVESEIPLHADTGNIETDSHMVETHAGRTLNAECCATADVTSGAAWVAVEAASLTKISEQSGGLSTSTASPPLSAPCAPLVCEPLHELPSHEALWEAPRTASGERSSRVRRGSALSRIAQAKAASPCVHSAAAPGDMSVDPRSKTLLRDVDEPEDETKATRQADVHAFLTQQFTDAANLVSLNRGPTLDNKS
jgi:hypothetical protein